MGKTLYLECNSGISGDMTVAALLDLGADEKVLLDSLKKLNVDGYEIRIGRTKKCGIDACDFDVILEQEDSHGGHSHSQGLAMNSSHSQQVGHSDSHSHEDGHSHNHEDGHIHSHEDGHTHSHEDGHTHSHEDGHTHSHEDGHTHSHEDGHSHSHEDGNTHSHENGHSHSHEDGHTHSHEDGHTHSHEDGHSHSHETGYSHTHEEQHNHNHENNVHELHGHSHHHSHEHRNITDVNVIIDRLEDEDVKELAKKIFLIVAKAEAKAHGIPLEEVHFHEVGAIDSIVDIVAVAICIKNLGIAEVIVSPLAEGSGTIRCQHGIIPVPVPAVMNIAIMNELVIKTTDNKGEMITPTGAAIAAALKTRDILPSQYIVKKIGIGAGKKDFEAANILRASIIEERKSGATAYERNNNNRLVQITEQNEQNIQNEQNTLKNSNDSETHIWKLESNIDDCTGEALGYTMEKLIEAGARDVFYTPIFMKKNRPAYLLSVICKEKDYKRLEDIIFAHTTTIGIRRIAYERTILDREIRTIMTSFGPAKVKLCKKGENIICYPEYESVREICEKEKIDFQQVYVSIINQFYQNK